MSGMDWKSSYSTHEVNIQVATWSIAKAMEKACMFTSKKKSIGNRKKVRSNRVEKAVEKKKKRTYWIRYEQENCWSVHCDKRCIYGSYLSLPGQTIDDTKALISKFPCKKLSSNMNTSIVHLTSTQWNELFHANITTIQSRNFTIASLLNPQEEYYANNNCSVVENSANESYRLFHTNRDEDSLTLTCPSNARSDERLDQELDYNNKKCGLHSKYNIPVEIRFPIIKPEPIQASTMSPNKKLKTRNYARSRYCKVAECIKLRHKNGLCVSHGGGWYCKKEGCTKHSKAKGFCSAHGGIRYCRIDGCMKYQKRKGLCTAHGRILARSLSENSFNWVN